MKKSKVNIVKLVTWKYQNINIVHLLQFQPSLNFANYPFGIITSVYGRIKEILYSFPSYIQSDQGCGSYTSALCSDSNGMLVPCDGNPLLSAV